MHPAVGAMTIFLDWPWGSTGAERYGFIPRSAANTLGEIPQKKGNSKPLVLKGFSWGGNTLGLVPSSLCHIVGYACTLYTPTSPLPIESPPSAPISEFMPEAVDSLMIFMSLIRSRASLQQEVHVNCSNRNMFKPFPSHRGLHGLILRWCA